MRDIFDLIRKYHLLPEESCILAERFCTKWNLSGYHALLEANLFSETELADKLAYFLKMDRIYEISCSSEEDALEAYQILPFKLAKEWECFPFMVEQQNKMLEIVIADPTQRKRIDELRRRTNRQIILAVGERKAILHAVYEYYPMSDQLSGLY